MIEAEIKYYTTCRAKRLFLICLYDIRFVHIFIDQCSIIAMATNEGDGNT
jgi:hypothetical protein